MRDERGRFASASASPKTPKTPKRVADLSEDQTATPADMLRKLVERVELLEEEKREMKEEIWRLRDKVEEEVWARGQIEEKLKRLEEEKEKEVENEIKRKEEKEGEKEKLKSEVKEQVKEEVKEKIK